MSSRAGWGCACRLRLWQGLLWAIAAPLHSRLSARSAAAHTCACRRACLTRPCALPWLLPQNDPLRRFYTTLKQQKPESEMATK